MRLTRASLLIFASATRVALIACSGGGGSLTQASGTEPSGGGEPTTGGDPSTSEGPLKIVSLSATAKTLVGGALSTESSKTTIVAIVTYGKGLDAIAGGEIKDDQGNVYGAFGASADRGTFTSTLDWETITAIAPPTFSASPSSRKLVARFFGNDGSSTEASLDIALACRKGTALVSACAGTCTDLKTSGTDCGSCEKPCGDGFACAAGTCKAPSHTPGVGSACTAVESVSLATTCLDVCALSGRTSTFTRFSGSASCAPSNSQQPANLPIRSETLLPYFRCDCQSDKPPEK